MAKQYRLQREAFEHLRANAPFGACENYVKALSVLVRLYNTKIRENRFIVGGAVEIFTCGLLRTAGVFCEVIGEEEIGGDLLLDGDEPRSQRLISLKSSFVRQPTEIGILNKQGTGSRVWKIPTFFVLAETGIVYGDPSMVPPSEMNDKADQLALPAKVLKRIIEDSSNVFPLEIERKSESVPPDARTASADVARRIIEEDALTHLYDALFE